MVLKFVQVQSPIDEMTTQEIKTWLDGLADSEIVRSILMAEIQEVRTGAPREERTLRGLWYDLVKPVLSRAGILNQKTSGGKPVPWDRKLSEYLAELIRAGEASYEELRIIDGSRQRQAARNLSATVANVQMVGGHYPWLILFTEKDTIWTRVQSLADLYGVSAISGSGQPSFACSENMVREIIRSDAFQNAQPEEITVISLTDYDPAGYEISEAQFQQVLDVVRALPAGELGSLKTVNHDRIGVEPYQLTREELEQKSYEPKDKGLRKWYSETGGINGHPLGLELDALPLSRLRRMFAEAIEARIDIAPRKQDLQEAFIELLAWDLVMPEVNKRIETMIDAVKSNGLWSAIQETKIPSDLFLQAAMGGDPWIAPVQTRKLFEEHAEAVKNVMQETE